MTKEEKRLYDIAYCKKNKARIAIRRKKYRLRTKEAKREYDKKHYQLCIDAKRAYGRDYSQKHRARRRPYAKNWMLMTKYGISIEQLTQMLDVQQGKCALCTNPFSNESDVCVDHDHTSGQNRELLCKRCNLGIGQLREDPKLLLKASNYLIKWGKT